MNKPTYHRIRDLPTWAKKKLTSNAPQKVQLTTVIWGRREITGTGDLSDYCSLWTTIIGTDHLVSPIDLI